MLAHKQGTPMMLMGDEYGHTRYGNNNSYGHDTAINHFQWEQVNVCLSHLLINPQPNLFLFLLEQLEARKDDHFRFFSEMIKFRHKHPVLRRDRFLSEVNLLNLNIKLAFKISMFVI